MNLAFVVLLQMPQLFISGKYIGGEEEIPRLHESGELRNIIAALATTV